MSKRCVLAVTLAFAGTMGAAITPAGAQDCDRYSYGCRGYPAQQPQQAYPPGQAAYGSQNYPSYPGYPRGYPQQQQQAYPGYQQAYPGYQQQQAYPGYQQGYPPQYGNQYPGYQSDRSYPPPSWGRQPAYQQPEPAEPETQRQTYSYDPTQSRRFASLYAALGSEPHRVPAVRTGDIDAAFIRTTVSYPTSEAPGTIVIDPQAHYLYLVQEGGTAIRYGVGVGRQGFGWSGSANVHVKREWPDWYPPKEMLARQPELMRHMSELQSGLGMPGGNGNPLGARALYLWQGNKDTLYRIHGTFEPWTIGKSVSSGCIRMINQDVIDLYQRVPEGAKVVVLGSRVG